MGHVIHKSSPGGSAEIVLRPYQAEAAQAAINALKAERNPVLQLATGTGKSAILSDVALYIKLRRGRVWVLTHIQELVAQNAKAYEQYSNHAPGIVCSGLNRAEYDRQVTFGTVQSIMRPALKGDIPAPHLIIVDEAHRVPHKTGEAGYYAQLFAALPEARRLGMTATPWRMDDGLIYGPDRTKFWFDEVAYKYTVPQAVAAGYLCPIVGVETEVQLSVEDLPVQGDYVQKEAGERETETWLTAAARSMGALAVKRKHIAVYCPSISAAQRAAAVITRETGLSSVVLSSGMSREDREAALRSFRFGRVRVLCSVDTVTTGFDFPALDCIVCLRPTLSSSLWVQILGRGTRKAEGKSNCLLLDYVGNLHRLGGVDMLDTYVREKALEVSEELPAEPHPPTPKAPRSLLPGVRTLAALDPTTGAQAADGAVLTLQVHKVSGAAIITRRNPGRKVLMVQYACTTPENARIDCTAFIDSERPKAEDLDFFSRRALALQLPAEAHKIQWVLKNARAPHSVRARKSGRYWSVVEEIF